MELKYVGVGIYSVSEASRLTGVHPTTIHRWARGDDEPARRANGRPKPVFQRDFPDLVPVTLSFADMVEVMYVDSFRKHNLSWKLIREAAAKAGSKFKSTHPFGTQRFETDGFTIFEDMRKTSNEQGLLDICTGQTVFDSMIRPILADLRFIHGRAARWLPMGESSEVVVDPARSFGKPIVDKSGVPTSVLAGLIAAGDSREAVCSAFDVSPKALDDALCFEQRFKRKRTSAA